MTKNFKGYSLVEKRDLPDIRSVGYLYKHDKTGAEVLYLENEDDNKAFNIAFRTPPYNDNGIAHIIEHSVKWFEEISIERAIRRVIKRFIEYFLKCDDIF